MAQAEYLTGLHGSPPVLLIDDIMGELDLKRRTGLLPLLERAHHSHGQVFMTATEENWPRGTRARGAALDSQSRNTQSRLTRNFSASIFLPLPRSPGFPPFLVAGIG